MKVALLFITINPPYWPYLKDVVEDAKKHFLPGHQVDYYVWSDMPEDTNYGATVFPTDSVEWPMGTLFRYHLFLQQEELLKTYDYVFYLDTDLRIVDTVGDEILGDGITAAQHPMYAFRNGLYAPFDANPKSTAYVKLPGSYFNERGVPSFKIMYYAGGFQGGKTEAFLNAMKEMRKNIDTDFQQNYIARWNDESHWNKYLTDNPPAVSLSPSYVYPDSLVNEYYIPLWGCNYKPKIVALTKPWTVTKEGGEYLQKVISGGVSVSKPRITIAIPCYNQAEYLPEAIESALSQTVKSEIIVVNDGSTDNSFEVMCKYPVKVINQTNRGLASARNSAIMAMTGDYFLPLDADDILTEYAVEKIQSAIETTKADVVAPSFKEFGTRQRDVILNQFTIEDFKQANRIGYFSAIRRESLVGCGGYSPRMDTGYEDYSLWFDLIKRGNRFAVIQEPLVRYRVKEKSMYTEAVKDHDRLMSQIHKDHHELWDTKSVS